MIWCQLQDRGCWVWVNVTIALLLSTGQEPRLNHRPPSIRALSARHNGSLMVTINNPFCWQSSYLKAPSVLLSAWSCPNDCVLWVQWKRDPNQNDGAWMWRIEDDQICREKIKSTKNETGVEDKSNSEYSFEKITENATDGFRQAVVCSNMIYSRYCKTE